MSPADALSQQTYLSQRTLERSTRDLAIGEDEEFAELVQRQSRFVYRVVYAVLLNRADAEDAVQETFLKLYRNGGWRSVENERAFLARVAWRVAVDRRPRRPEPVSFDNETEDATKVEVHSSGPGPEEAAIAANAHALIHALIDKLPEELRVPLVLSSFEELNSREIGRVLGIPEGTVRTRLKRARELLRQKFETAGKSTQRNSLKQEASNV